MVYTLASLKATLVSASFSSDPGPVIVYPCQQGTAVCENWLMKIVTQYLMLMLTLMLILMLMLMLMLGDRSSSQ